MKPILFFLALFALLTLGLTCACHAADTSSPPLVVDWTLDAAPPVLIAACPGGQCAAPARGRITPVKAVLDARPLQRVRSAVRNARPLQRIGSVIRERRPGLIGLAPVRWLFRR